MQQTKPKPTTTTKESILAFKAECEETIRLYESLFGPRATATPIEGASLLPVDCTPPYKIGQQYFIRTATFHLIGRLVEVHQQELVIEQASCVFWPNETFGDMLATGKCSDVQHFPPGPVIIGRGAIVDVTPWPKPLLAPAK